MDRGIKNHYKFSQVRSTLANPQGHVEFSDDAGERRGGHRFKLNWSPPVRQW